MSSRAEDRSYIDVIAYYLNRRQAAKIRDTSNVITLKVTRDSGIKYWCRGVEGGIWVYSKGPGGGYLWDKIVHPGGLSTLLAGTDQHEVLHDYDDVPGRIRQGPTDGDY